MAENHFPDKGQRTGFDIDRSDIKVLGFFILFSLLIITSLVMMIWNHKNISKEMTVSVKKHSEIIKTSRACLSNVGLAHRMLLNLAIVIDTTERAKLSDVRTQSLGKNELSFSSLQAYYATEADNNSELINKIKISKANYLKSSSEFLELTKQDDRAKISEFLLKDLKPKYEVYQDQQKQVYEQLNNQLVQQTNEITDSSNSIAWVLFAIGIFPFIFVLFKTAYFLFSTRTAI